MPEREAGLIDSKVDRTMKSFSLDGMSFVGILTYRDEVKIPVYTVWDGKGITGRPAVYGGSIYNGTLVIGGADRRGQLTFAKSCDAGDRITFTDVFGREFRFSVREIKHTSRVSEETLLKKDRDPLVLFVKTGISEYIIINCTT